MLKFYHCNHSVTDIERSIQFYGNMFGLKVLRRIEACEGGLKLAFLGDGQTAFQMELTWYRDHPQPFELGCKEFHLAFSTDDFDATLARHQAAGILRTVDAEHRLYFIEDPDGYSVEIVEKR